MIRGQQVAWYIKCTASGEYRKQYGRFLEYSECGKYCKVLTSERKIAAVAVEQVGKA